MTQPTNFGLMPSLRSSLSGAEWAISCSGQDEPTLADKPRIETDTPLWYYSHDTSSNSCIGAGSDAMAVNFRSVLPALAWISTLGLAGLVSAQPPAPTADRPHLAKDAKEAMDFLATWARVTSGEEYFKGASY